jgi:hypothetical protein
MRCDGPDSQQVLGPSRTTAQGYQRVADPRKSSSTAPTGPQSRASASDIPFSASSPSFLKKGHISTDSSGVSRPKSKSAT